jgi:hypothetical protein
MVQPFEDAHVGIWTKLITVDARVRMPRDHFVVAGIGKCLAIRDARDAALVLVAENLPLPGHHTPEEWEKQPAAFGYIVPPILAAQGFGFGPYASVLGIHEGRIRAGKHFLPAQSVTDDQHNILGLGLSLRRRRCEPQREQQDDNQPAKPRHEIPPEDNR